MEVYYLFLLFSTTLGEEEKPRGSLLLPCRRKMRLSCEEKVAWTGHEEWAGTQRKVSFFYFLLIFLEKWSQLGIKIYGKIYLRYPLKVTVLHTPEVNGKKVKARV